MAVWGVDMTEPGLLAVEAYLDRLVDATLLPWISTQVPVPGGLGEQAVKLLHGNPATGAYVLLGRYPAGLVIRRHEHLAAVHSWIIEGSWRFTDSAISATSGCYSYEPLGAVHSLIIEEDTVAFHVVKGPLIVLADHDGITGKWDWKSTQITWRQAVEEMGLAPTAWRPDRS